MTPARAHFAAVADAAPVVPEWPILDTDVPLPARVRKRCAACPVRFTDGAAGETLCPTCRAEAEAPAARDNDPSPGGHLSAEARAAFNWNTQAWRRAKADYEGN